MADRDLSVPVDPSTEFNVVDLFCGSGAVTSALSQQGFQVIGAVDNDPVVCRTYRRNHPTVNLIEEDIRFVNPTSLIGESPNLSRVSLLVVCAPCQPFSSQNRRKGPDERANLILQAARFAEELDPDCILFENVAGIMTKSGAAILVELRKQLMELEYSLSEVRKVDAADLGVPQRRVRCMMIASRSKDAISYFETYDFPSRHRTVRQAISHLPALANGERDPSDPLHCARKHAPIVLERLSHISKDGGSRSELPEYLQLDCHKRQDASSFSDVYGRMFWDNVAPTLTTGCTDLTRGRFVHPEQDRAITLREAALLQTFPSDYCFEGNLGEVATQIGNAVPVAMLEALAPMLMELVRMGMATGDLSRIGPAIDGAPRANND